MNRRLGNRLLIKEKEASGRIRRNAVCFSLEIYTKVFIGKCKHFMLFNPMGFFGWLPSSVALETSILKCTWICGSTTCMYFRVMRTIANVVYIFFLLNQSLGYFTIYLSTFPSDLADQRRILKYLLFNLLHWFYRFSLKFIFLHWIIS